MKSLEIHLDFTNINFPQISAVCGSSIPTAEKAAVIAFATEQNSAILKQ